MKGWFCRSALGPGPSVATGVTRVKGFPGQVMTAKKNVEIAASVAPAHGRSDDVAVAVEPDDQARPAGEQQRPEQDRALERGPQQMTLKNGGVVVALLRAT